MTNSPVPANSLTPCPFGGNPKVAAQMGFPSCGIARPGPFFNDLNLGKPTSGGRKSRRRGGRKSRRGGVDTVVPNAPAETMPEEVPLKKPVEDPLANKQQCPEECIKKGCGKRNFLHSIFGASGGRKSRKSRRGGRKSRRGGRKSRRGGRKSRRGGRKSRR